MKTIQTMKGHSKILLCSILILVVAFTCGFVWRTKDIRIIADGKEKVIQTHDIFAESVVEDAGIKLGEYDAIKLNTPQLTNGTIITIVRAFPIKVNVNGKTNDVMTTVDSAEELIKELKLSPKKYVVTGDYKRKLIKDSVVNISKVTKILKQTVDKPIEIETIQEPDDTMPKGLGHIVKEGKEGLATVTEDVYYVGDKIVQTKTLKQKVKVKMTPRVMKVGTRSSMIGASRGVMRYTKKVTLEATAYTVNEGNGDGLTATGLEAKRGIVAVDPNVIPLGSRLYIPGYGLALAADTGGAIQGHRIDLLMDSYDEAIKFGRRAIDIYVLQ